MSEVTVRRRFSLTKVIETIIFSSRWILVPLYLGLSVALVLYSYKFAIELWHMCREITEISEGDTMLILLGLLDVTMVANLVVMVMIGGYSSFVRKIEFAELQDRPQGFTHLSAGLLKVKMGMSLIGVSSIHLLKQFINSQNTTWRDLSMMLAIHLAFIVGSLAMAKVDAMCHTQDKGDNHGHQNSGH